MIARGGDRRTGGEEVYMQAHIMELMQAGRKKHLPPFSSRHQWCTSTEMNAPETDDLLPPSILGISFTRRIVRWCFASTCIIDVQSVSPGGSNQLGCMVSPHDREGRVSAPRLTRNLLLRSVGGYADRASSNALAACPRSQRRLHIDLGVGTAGHGDGRTTWVSLDRVREIRWSGWPISDNDSQQAPEIVMGAAAHDNTARL